MQRPASADETLTSATDAASITVHGVLVRYFRKERELSIHELAELVGVGSSYVTKIELGYSLRVSVPVYRKLRSALGLGNSDQRVLMANPYGIDDAEGAA